MKYSFASRRSAVMSTGGMVASSQPLTTQAGVSLLQQSGNAIDAAIATAAALNVVEPMSTGIGGDAFALVYLSRNKELQALNASGRSPYATSLEGTGICLQNRGALFSLEPDHPNCLAPHKRPYHTIIPAMVFKDGNLFLTFGVMGGFMQPQGQLQALLNIIDFRMGVQTALNAPRFRYYLQTNECAFEPGIPSRVRQKLATKGHRIIALEDPYSQQFGGGQVIMVDPLTKALIAGSDPRKDGCAIGLWYQIRPPRFLYGR